MDLLVKHNYFTSTTDLSTQNEKRHYGKTDGETILRLYVRVTPMEMQERRGTGVSKSQRIPVLAVRNNCICHFRNIVRKNAN